MKQLFSVAGLFIILMSCSQAQQSIGKGNTLYPFRDGEHWGFADENGSIRIPCKYVMVSFQKNYLVGFNEDLHVTVYNTSGQEIDTGYDLLPLHNSALLLKEDAAGNRQEPDLANLPPELQDLVNNQHEWKDWNGTALILDSNGKSLPIPGQVKRMLLNDGLLWLQDNGKEVVYSVNQMAYLIPPQARPIRYVTGGFFLTDKDGANWFIAIDGKKFSLPARANNASGILDERYFTIARPQVGQVVYKTDGSPLISDSALVTPLYDPQANRIFAWTQRTGFGNTAKYSLHDTDGKLIADDIYRATPVLKSTVLVDYLDKPNHRYGYKMMAVDVRTHKTLLSFADPYTEIKIQYGFLIVRNKQRPSTDYYYSCYGKLLQEMPAAPGQGGLSIELPLSRISYDGTHRSTGFFALRNSPDKPFTVYDAEGKVIADGFENLFNDQSEFVLGKKNGKWGLYNNYWQLKIPIEYDSILPEGSNHFWVLKDGKTSFIDTNGKRIPTGIAPTVFSDNSFNGRRLVTKSQQDGISSSAFEAVITDSAGRIIYTWEGVKQSYSYIYMLTPGSKIFGYSIEGQKPASLLYEPKTKDLRTSDYSIVEIPEADLPLAFVVKNGKNETAVISTLDLRTIVPFGKYSDIKIKTNKNTPNKMKPGVFIYGTNTKTNKEDMVGYYGVNGISYWRN